MRRTLSVPAAGAAVSLVSVTLAASTLAGGSVNVRGEVPWNFATWVDEGVTYDISVNGYIHTAKIPYYHDPGVSKSANGPEGQSAACLVDYENALNGECMIEDVGFGTLIGIVINGDTGQAEAPPFAIGADTSFTAPANGFLFLGINDLSLTFDDNSGQFTVVITVP